MVTFAGWHFLRLNIPDITTDALWQEQRYWSLAVCTTLRRECVRVFCVVYLVSCCVLDAGIPNYVSQGEAKSTPDLFYTPYVNERNHNPPFTSTKNDKLIPCLVSQTFNWDRTIPEARTTSHLSFNYRMARILALKFKRHILCTKGVSIIHNCGRYLSYHKGI